LPTIQESIKVVLLCAVLAVVVRPFIGFFEAGILLPLKIVFHIPLSDASFLEMMGNPSVATSVSIRFAMLAVVPFVIFRFLAHCESEFGTPIGPQIKRIAALVFSLAAMIAAVVYPLLLRIDFRAVSPPFSGHPRAFLY